MCLVDITREALRKQALQLELDLGHRLGVEQLAKVFATEQLRQQVAVESECLGSALGQRRVPLVHEDRHIREEERRRERRGALGVDGDHAHLARADASQEVGERGHVEVIAHHLAPRLGQDWEVRVLAGDLQQVRAAHALLPQRRALARPPARQQQRARCVLSKMRGEQSRRGELGGNELLHLFRLEDQLLQRRRRFDVRKVEGDAVVGPQRAGVDRQALLEASL